MNFRELMAARYSVRDFSDRPVEPDKLALILEAGRNAPTAGNRQPERILVIDQAGGLEKVDACTPCRYGAPLALLTAYDKKEHWIRKFDGKTAGIVDAGIVTTYMMLQAVDLGLGSLWVMHFDPAKTVEAFRFPSTLVPEAFLMLGYPGPGAAPSERHQDRHPLEKLVFHGDFSAYG